MLSRLKGILRNKGFELYTGLNELNIVGVRSTSTDSNRFDDEIHVFYRTGLLSWNYHVYRVTTDPGTYWLENPAYPQGTAILREGQYRKAYALGKHQGKYTALVQVAPVSVFRDYDRNAILDFKNGRAETGIFGINIHRASLQGSTLYIDKYSAGCQVFRNAEEFDEFIQLCSIHAKEYGNLFSYTLLDFRAISRITLKRIAMAVTLAGTLVLGYIFKNERFRNEAA